ncbi:MAG: hypothetical protein ACTSW2_01265 [Alphaproteobacteria bacterium]
MAIGIALPSPVERGQGIAVACRFHCPIGLPTPRRSIAADIRETFNEAQMPFNIGEILYDDLQRERAGAYVFAEASQLRHLPLML